MRVRRAVSLTMLLAFSVMAYSGIMLFVSPHGRVAYWAGWKLWGLGKDQYSQVHTTFMVLFLITGIWHIVLNWRPITAYLKDRSRKLKILVPEFYVALVLVVLFLVGTLTDLQPFGAFLSAGEDVKDWWEARTGSPPWGHAEENTLARFTRGLENWERLDNQRLTSFAVEDAMAALAAEGISVSDSNQKMIDIAALNGTTPQALMAVILRAGEPRPAAEPAATPAADTGGLFPRPLSGLGRMTFRDYAERYDVDLELALSRLSAHGVTIDPDVRLKEEAERLDTDPEGLIEMLSRRAAP